MRDKPESQSFKTRTVESIMTKEVKSVTLLFTIKQAIELILEYKISGAPVIDQSQNVVSVLSEGDLLKLAASVGLDELILNCMSKLVSSKKVVSIRKSDTLMEAYRLFLNYPVDRLLVLDASGKIQGIVTRSNILRMLIARDDNEPATESAS